MALKRLLHPTNRRIRWLVGALLVGLFCIQCTTQVGQIGRPSTLIAKSAEQSPAEAARIAVELARTDHLALLRHCLANYDRRHRDYTCTLLKQERIKGVLSPEQEIQVKFLDSPFSVVMKWVRNAPIGDVMLYVEGKHDNQMIVRPSSGLLRALTGGTVFRKPDGADAMRNTLRPVNLFGFRRGMRELTSVYTQAKEAGDLKEAFGGLADVAGRKTVVLERYLPPKGEYPAWKTLIYIDLEHLVPTCIEGFDWDNRLSCRYLYKDLRFNVGLTPNDFAPESNGLPTPK